MNITTLYTGRREPIPRSDMERERASYGAGPCIVRPMTPEEWAYASQFTGYKPDQHIRESLSRRGGQV